MTDFTSEKLRIRDLENADKLSTKRLVLEYRHLLQVLRAEHQYALLSAEQLDELKGVPLDDGVLSFFGDYHVLCNLLYVGDCHWLYEIFDIDRLTFLSIRSAGIRRWKELIALRYQIVEQFDSFLEYFKVCYVRVEYPVLDAERNYSLAEKFEIGFDQMLAHLKRVAEYKPVLRKDLDYLQWFFVDKLDLAGVATRVKITTERARQIRMYLLGQLRHGFFKMADHVRLSSDLMLDLQFVENSSPRYKTAPLLKAALGCEHYDDTVLAGVLSLKKTHNEGEKTYSFVNFDQPYYVPESEFLGTVKTYMACLYKVFVGEGAEVRPMTLDQIMDYLSALDPETEFSMDIVQGILDQHLWLEKSELDGVRRYQMEYVRLHDYQKFARIIYEQKRVSVEEAERIDREKSTDGEYITSITNIWNTTSGHYSWVCTGGQSGVYVYNESGKATPQLMEVIKAYTKERKMCRFEEVMDYLRGLNWYQSLKEVTVRAYILLSCQPSNDDGNLFCHSDYLAEYPDYSWRSRTRAGVMNWIIRHTLTALKETADGQLKFSVIHKLLKEEAEKSEEKYDVKNYMYYLGQYTGADNIFEKSEDEKTLLLTEKGRNLTDLEISRIGVRNVTPDYYWEVVATIQTALRAEPSGMLLLRDLKAECERKLELFLGTRFYKIVDNLLPDQIVKMHKDGDAYLKLIEEKIAYAPSMVIDTKQEQNKEITSPKLVAEKEERAALVSGSREAFVWDQLVKDMEAQLAFYGRWWNIDMSLSEGIMKFRNFISQVESKRLSDLLPQYIYEFWHFKNDEFDYFHYLSELALCFEQLLVSIEEHNSGMKLQKSGLSTIVHQMDEVKAWVQNGDNSYDGFIKIYSSLKYVRNTLAHGDDLNETLVSMIQKISNFIALYVYTVARFCH